MAGDVCSTDPLLFTCELIKVVYLQIVFPTGDHDYISLGSTAATMKLPAGFIVEFLYILEMDYMTRSISLALSIANASLLEGGEIKCYDSLGDGVMAGCPPHGKSQSLV